MREKKSDVVLHPVRMRIIRVLAGREGMTAKEIGAELVDIPEASLYRHLNRLESGGILDIASTRRVRGAVEKRYVLPEGAAVLGKADLEEATKDDYLRMFTTFCTAMMRDFERYLDSPDVNLERDGVGFRQHPVYLSDGEFLEYLARLRSLIAEASALPNAPGRKRRTLSTIWIPEPTVLAGEKHFDDEGEST